MSEVIKTLQKQLNALNFHFTKKPILIGGMAKEYYGIRKSGGDSDLVVCDEDYQALALVYPDSRVDAWGDLGVRLMPFEIWRSIARFDYDFFSKNAVDEEIVFVVSLDRLLFMKVIAMDYGAHEKYKNDLHLLKEHYKKHFVNQGYCSNMEKNMASYEKSNGVVLGGRYLDPSNV